MGQFSLLAVVGAFLISAVVVFNASSSAGSAEEKVWEHQYHVIARDAASTGMSATTRRLSTLLNTGGPWSGATATAVQQTDVDYDGGRYTVTAFSSPNDCSIMTSANYAAAKTEMGIGTVDGEVIEVRSTGVYDGRVGDETEQSHQQVACFIKADWGLFSPPAFNFGFISDTAVVFNGGADINALVDGQGHVHSNWEATIGPKVNIDGVLTYIDGTGSRVSDRADIEGGAEVVVDEIPLTPFDADEFAEDLTGAAGATRADIPAYCSTNPEACAYSAGFTSAGDLTISPPTADSTHRKDNPYVWYIDGDFTLSGGDHITIPQYTTIVVTGEIKISGQSAVTVTGQTVYDVYGMSPTDDQMRAWVVSQLFDGETSPLAWYGEGGVDVNGTSALIGNFYVNGDVTLDGGGLGNNTAGSFASTGGTITANGGGGGGNFWFLEVAEENVIDGVKLPGKQIIRLALAEWTDPVLDHTP